MINTKTNKQKNCALALLGRAVCSPSETEFQGKKKKRTIFITTMFKMEATQPVLKGNYAYMFSFLYVCLP